MLAVDFAARAVTTARRRPLAPPEVRAQCGWQQADLAPLQGQWRPAAPGALLGQIQEQGAKYRHSRGRAFSEHLEGVSGLLAYWDAPTLLVEGGLCHSIYSTQQYPYGLYDYAQRAVVREQLGAELERLVFLFCSHDRVDLYAQAIDLARAGRVLPEAGLQLRNALTGEHANVPRDVVASLLMIHAADIIEQMNGFEFEFAFAVFYVLQPCFELPGCFAELQAGGLAPERLSIRINPQRGTFGLYPILGLTPHLLDMRTRLNVALRGRDELSKRATTALLNLQARHPYLFDLAWLLARRGNLAHGEQALLMQKRAEQLLRAWGAPWLKSPFDADAKYLGLRQAQLSTS